MPTLKSTSETGKSPKPDAGRRSFIRKTGAAMTAVLASAAVGVSKSKTDAADPLQILEDMNAIRNLHKTYETRLDKGMYEEVVSLFSEDAEVFYNGGIFKGRKGVQRLYVDHFSRGVTGKRIEPAPGFQPEQQETIEVAPDRKTAKARFPYSIQVGEPMTANSSLVEMARLQGEGIVKWWEGGIYEAAYVKLGESWRIKRLEYRTASKADYKPGQTYARPMDVPAFSSAFPENPTGPDKLIKAIHNV
jgi:hypothetical protein